jgi:hypothetical protein
VSGPLGAASRDKVLHPSARKPAGTTSGSGPGLWASAPIHGCTLPDAALINHRSEAQMAEKVEDLTVAYSEGGTEIVRELDKAILSKGGWATVLFRYREWEPAKQQFGPEKYSIRRYQKRGGEFRQQSKFNISSRAQAEALIEALRKWLDEAN